MWGVHGGLLQSLIPSLPESAEEQDANGLTLAQPLASQRCPGANATGS